MEGGLQNARLGGSELLLARLLSEHHFLHLLDGHGTLDVDPLVGDHVLLLELETEVDTADVAVGHEAKAARLLRPFVLEDDAVFNVAEVFEVLLKTAQLEIVRQPADEDFAELRIDLFAAVQGLFP